ncbi:MAG: methyltransferase [Proteobacteria bacterium]|nr:methyltransferase [Pseudomonadota bacterium]MDA1022364.1 methyltransferase [Pseudomonadota bacterium]
MPDIAPETPFSRDTLLGGRVILLQPENGFRAAIDAVLLAAAIPATSGDRVLDAGSGTGAASLTLSVRVPGVRVTGLECQADLAALARQSALENELDTRVSFIEGDVLTPPPSLAPGSFDHVMANPPYLAEGTGHPPPDSAKRAATVEGEAKLGDWLRFLMSMVRDGGSVSVVHRYDRIDEVVQGLEEKWAGKITIFPFWPKTPGKDAKRAIIQLIKGKNGKTRISDGLVLHQKDGAYTPEAEAVLRDAQPLTL